MRPPHFSLFLCMDDPLSRAKWNYDMVSKNDQRKSPSKNPKRIKEKNIITQTAESTFTTSEKYYIGFNLTPKV